MYPTATRAGEISPPKKRILFPIKIAPSITPLNKPAKEINP